MPLELLQYVSDDYSHPFRLIIGSHKFKLTRTGFHHLVDEIDRIYSVSESDFAREVDALYKGVKFTSREIKDGK